MRSVWRARRGLIPFRGSRCAGVRLAQSEFRHAARADNIARPATAGGVRRWFTTVERGKLGREAEDKEEYTTAFAFFEALWEAGVKASFVNLGSDHPSIIDAIVKGKTERPDRFPKIYTCPSEMTAISMADGYARVTGRPQAVIVHVDVGTQALAHGVHNASIGRAPVLIFSGLSPFTEAGELAGSRTEYMHWLQDAPDQKALVRQFCRHVGEIRTGKNAKQSVARALQFAASDPKGPAYLAAAREVLAEKVMPYSLVQEQCGPIGPGALTAEAVETIAHELVHAERPMVITGYVGRNKKCPEELVKLADAIPGLRVLDCGGSDMCFPRTHRASQGFRLATHECTKDADLILVVDCDVPWIPSLNPPSKDAKIYHIDVDPLNYMMPVSFFPANGRWRADSYTALTQLNDHIQSSLLSQELTHPKFRQRWHELGNAHNARMAEISKLPTLGPSDVLTAHNIGALLKKHLPPDAVYIIEAVTCAQALSDQLQPEVPGSWLNAGGTGIGWSNGAALGAKLAVDSSDLDEKREERPTWMLAQDRAEKDKDKEKKKPSFVCQVVGDGSYMCGSPASAAWVGAKYNIPILTILLNNGGWNAPRNSALLVYPDGPVAAASNENMSISFDPSPSYAAMAAAASGGAEVSGLVSRKVGNVADFEAALEEGVRAVEGRKGAFVEAVLERRE